MIIIYALLHNEQVFYIGRTNNKIRRFRDHIYSKTGKTRKDIYIQQLKNNNIKIGIKILQRCNKEEARKLEVKWIYYYENIGVKLCNSHWISKKSIPYIYKPRLNKI